jgi:hypothetical protein
MRICFVVNTTKTERHTNNMDYFTTWCAKFSHRNLMKQNSALQLTRAGQISGKTLWGNVPQRLGRKGRYQVGAAFLGGGGGRGGTTNINSYQGWQVCGSRATYDPQRKYFRPSVTSTVSVIQFNIILQVCRVWCRNCTGREYVYKLQLIIFKTAHSKPIFLCVLSSLVRPTAL